jgi:hypothetical protein
MAVSIIPRVERGRLYFETADVLFPSFVSATSDRSPHRRCVDCQLHLTGDVLRALGSCPRWGKPRHGVESHCPAFVAKDGAR